jgi:hypothetical protein
MYIFVLIIIIILIILINRRIDRWAVFSSSINKELVRLNKKYDIELIKENIGREISVNIVWPESHFDIKILAYTNKYNVICEKTEKHRIGRHLLPIRSRVYLGTMKVAKYIRDDNNKQDEEYKKKLQEDEIKSIIKAQQPKKKVTKPRTKKKKNK